MILAEYANAEATATIAQYVAAGCFAWVAYNLVYGMKNPEKCNPIGIPDKIPLGYIDDSYIPVTMSVQEDELKSLEREVKIAKLREQLVRLKANQVHAPNSKNKPKDQSDVNSIVKECVDALVSMGENKSVAISTVNKYFTSNPNTKTVEEFIAGVFKK